MQAVKDHVARLGSVHLPLLTASLSSPGRREQARLESASGIGSTEPGTYTLVERRKASPPGGRRGAGTQSRPR